MALLEALNAAYDRHFDVRTRSKVAKLRLDSGVGTLSEHFEIQQELRPLFGKGAPVPPSIGDHPDFVHLKGTTDVAFAPVTTLFMDMEGSTRLGLIYEPQQVYQIKNAFIQTTIDIIKSFDGHVHRIMGDAVMAYF